MLKELRIYKYGLLIGLMLPTVVFSQDLGSSSGLFNNPKTKSLLRQRRKKPRRTEKNGCAT
jgi:hypothetical protein